MKACDSAACQHRRLFYRRLRALFCADASRLLAHPARAGQASGTRFRRCNTALTNFPWLLACWVLFIGPMAAYCQTAAKVRVVDLAGESHTGSLIEISQSEIRIGGDTPLDRQRADILRIDWAAQPESLLENGPQLVLANGDRLGIRPTSINEESLKGRWEQFPAWPEVEFPLETVRGALLIPPRNPLERSTAIVKLRDQRETQDCFYLSNEDRLLGQLEGFAEETFQLTAATGKVSLPIGTVRGFGMNPELTSFPAAKVPVSILTLSDGSLLTVRDVTYNGRDRLKCHAQFGAELQFPLDHVVSLQFLGERIVYLSELEPEQFSSTPYLSRTWPLRRNLNAVGGPLRVGPKEYARGLGMHSQSLVTYNLNGKYLSFQSTIGIDGVTEGRGSVVFRVLGDGKPLFTSEVVRGKTSPIIVGPLAMQSVQKLTLTVDFADQGDILDHADWCDAVLIKAP